MGERVTSDYEYFKNEFDTKLKMAIKQEESYETVVIHLLLFLGKLGLRILLLLEKEK